MAIQPAPAIVVPSSKGMLCAKGALAALTVSASMKDDSAAIASSLYMTELTHHPIVQIVQQLSPVLSLMFLLLAALSFVYGLRGRFWLRGEDVLIISIPWYAAVRNLFEPDAFETRFIGGFVITLMIIVYLAMILRSWGPRAVVEVCIGGLTASSMVFVALNGLELVTSYGFVSGSSRMIGTGGHPNITGVQAASGAILFMPRILAPGRLSRLLFGFFALMAIALVYQTGSRTAIVVFVVGAFYFVWARARFSLAAPFLTGLLVVALAILALNFTSLDAIDMSKFDRGDTTDTRSEAWAYLFDAVVERPFFGMGTFGPFAENSYLRGWSSWGVFYMILLAGLIIRASAGIVWSVRNVQPTETAAVLGALLFALIAGAVLEGYLIDSFSGQMMAWLLCCIACTQDFRAMQATQTPRGLALALGQVQARQPAMLKPARRVPRAPSEWIQREAGLGKIPRR